jgi:hypothetical protein
LKRQRRREATASDSHSPEVHRREGYHATVKIEPVLFHCASAYRLPPAVPLEAHAEVLCRGRRRRNSGVGTSLCKGSHLCGVHGGDPIAAGACASPEQRRRPRTRGQAQRQRRRMAATRLSASLSPASAASAEAPIRQAPAVMAISSTAATAKSAAMVTSQANRGHESHSHESTGDFALGGAGTWANKSLKHPSTGPFIDFPLNVILKGTSLSSYRVLCCITVPYPVSSVWRSGPEPKFSNKNSS